MYSVMMSFELLWHIEVTVSNLSGWFGTLLSPGSGLDKPTDRDQRSWVFLNYPKEYFATDRTPKKYFPKSKTLKNAFQKHYSFGKS